MPLINPSDLPEEAIFDRIDRFKLSGRPSDKAPPPIDIDPDSIQFDKIDLAVRLRDQQGNMFVSGDVDKVEASYSTRTYNQAFYFEMSYSNLYVHSALYPRGPIQSTKSSDFFSWLSRSREIRVDLFLSSSATTGGQFRIIQTGYLDTQKVAFLADTVRFNCRDFSALMWENRVTGTSNNYTTLNLLDRISKVYGRRVYALLGPVIKPLGILDNKGAERYLMRDGIRMWDLLQYAATMDDRYAFAYRGALFYLRETEIQDAVAKFFLTYNKNLVSLEIEHSLFSSQNSAVVMPVNSVVNPGDTVYIIVTDLAHPPRTETTAARLQELKDKNIYKAPRHNVDLHPELWAQSEAAKLADADKLSALYSEAISLYRDLVGKEYTLYVTFSGHWAADIFNNYVLMGTGTFLDGQIFIPKHVTWNIDKTSGWTVHAVLNNAVQMSGAQLGAQQVEETGAVQPKARANWVELKPATNINEYAKSIGVDPNTASLEEMQKVIDGWKMVKQNRGS
jgi:hypothetical protein